MRAYLDYKRITSYSTIRIYSLIELPNLLFKNSKRSSFLVISGIPTSTIFFSSFIAAKDIENRSILSFNSVKISFN